MGELLDTRRPGTDAAQCAFARSWSEALPPRDGRSAMSEATVEARLGAASDRAGAVCAWIGCAP